MREINENRIRISTLDLRLNNYNWIQRCFFKSGLKFKIEKAKSIQLDLINEYLLKTNEVFRKMVDENYSCFKSEIKFKVSSEGFSFKGTYTKKMKGNVHRNGCAYLDAVDTNIDFGLFDRFTYPKIMVGKIDFLGEITLKTEKVGQSLFKSIPTDLDGLIFNNNQLKVEIVKRGFEPYNKHLFMDRIVGYVIEDDEKLDLFFSNKSRLEKIRNEFIEKMEDSV